MEGFMTKMPNDMPSLTALLDIQERGITQVLIGTTRQFPPTWYLVMPDGTCEIAHTPWGNDREKVIVRNFMRNRMKEIGAIAYGCTLEAWAASIPPNQDLNEEWERMRPSLREDRREMVMIFATDGFNCEVRDLDIVRDKDGNCIGLPVSDLINDSNNLSSPFMNLLGGTA
jgi:hypothetical protein